MTLKIWACCFGSTFAFNNLVFLRAWQKEDNGIMDMAWSWSLFIPNAVAMLLTKSYKSPRALLSNGLIFLWSSRLSYHISQRHTGKEDYRYAKWREDWKKEGKNVAYESWSFVFMLQAFFGCVNNASALYISIKASKGGRLNRLDAAGVFLWALGFGFEALGDKQLDDFKKDPKNQGKVCKEGVWRYTRHPNYFGEACSWWGIYLMACNLGLGGKLTIFSAVTITYLVRYISGVDMLERKQKLKPEFQVYMKETSPFLPMPYKNVSETEKQIILSSFQ